MRGTRRTLAAVSAGLVAIVATGITTSAYAMPDRTARGSEHHTVGAHSPIDADLNGDLAQLRRVTARFHDLDAALAAGYELGWVNGSGDPDHHRLRR